MIEPVTQEEFHIWKDLRVTQEVRERMNELRQAWVNRLTNGQTLCGAGATREETAKAVGFIGGIDLFLEAEWEGD